MCQMWESREGPSERSSSVRPVSFHLSKNLQSILVISMFIVLHLIVPEAMLHDIGRWPHLYDEEMREYMFPTAVAAPEVESATAEELDEHGRLHRRWAARRVTVSRG